MCQVRTARVSTSEELRRAGRQTVPCLRLLLFLHRYLRSHRRWMHLRGEVHRPHQTGKTGRQAGPTTDPISSSPGAVQPTKLTSPRDLGAERTSDCLGREGVAIQAESAERTGGRGMIAAVRLPATLDIRREGRGARSRSLVEAHQARSLNSRRLIGSDPESVAVRLVETAQMMAGGEAGTVALHQISAEAGGKKRDGTVDEEDLRGTSKARHLRRLALGNVGTRMDPRPLTSRRDGAVEGRLGGRMHYMGVPLDASTLCDATATALGGRQLCTCIVVVELESRRPPQGDRSENALVIRAISQLNILPRPLPQLMLLLPQQRCRYSGLENDSRDGQHL